MWRLVALHAALLLVLVVGVSPFALALCLASLVVRLFGITAGYHRLFSHRSYATSRAFAFALAWLGASSGQRGPLWWAAHHRRHHRHADRAGDPHSPVDGRFFSHVGWVLKRESLATDESVVGDWARFPELRWLNRFHVLPAAAWALACFAVGAAASRWAPQCGTDGAQCFVWGFVVATIAGVHVVSAVNSLAHASPFGSRAYDTGDLSRNVWWLALPALGDGWHNNHHRFPRAARHGLRWYELDLTYLGLRALAVAGVVWELRGADAGSNEAEQQATGASCTTGLHDRGQGVS